ncbi:hypothetical protein ACFLXQ_08810, partial [Chloroflexota bacterium]
MSQPKFEFIKSRLGTISEIGERSKKLDMLTIGKFIGQALVLGMLVIIAWILFARLPVTYQDWSHTFRPAALHWQDPYYRESRVFNPPWIFPVLYPLALLPNRVGAGLLIIVSVIAVTMYTGSIKKTLIVAASAPMAVLIALGQLDALLLFGLVIPYGLGIPILVAKPQAVFLTILPRLNRWSILFTLLVFALSIFIWGDWWTNIIGHQLNVRANMSLFPYTIILGIPLAFWGLRRKSDALLCLGSLCFAPYFMTH